MGLAALAGGDLSDDAAGRGAVLRHAGRGAEVSLHHARLGARGSGLGRRVACLRHLRAELRRLQRNLRQHRRHHRAAAVFLYLRRRAAAGRRAECGDRAPFGGRQGQGRQGDRALSHDALANETFVRPEQS